MVARPFPPPWSVDEQAACFIVRDRGGQALAYVYFEEEPMDMLTILGLFAVTAMLVFYALEDQSPWYIVAFAGACARLRLWLSPRRVALRAGRSNMGWRSSMALASEGEECLEVAKARSDLPNVI